MTPEMFSLRKKLAFFCVFYDCEQHSLLEGESTIYFYFVKKKLPLHLMFLLDIKRKVVSSMDFLTSIYAWGNQKIVVRLINNTMNLL